MSIATTKLMNLADGKVLYDDLRARVDNNIAIVPVFSFDGNGYICNMTYSQVYSAVQNKQCTSALASGVYLFLDSANNNGVWFKSFDKSSAEYVRTDYYSIRNDDSVDVLTIETDERDSIANYEYSDTSSHAYSVGDLFMYCEYNDSTTASSTESYCTSSLRRAIANIAVGDAITHNNCERTTIADELSSVNSALTQTDGEVDDLNEAVFTSGQEEIIAPDLFLDVTDTDIMLAIGETSFSQATASNGFYVNVSDYRGQDLLIKRTYNGYVLRGVFTHDVPAVGVTYSMDDRWIDEGDKKYYYLTVPNNDNINYLYIIYYNANNDTITKQQALDGMSIFKPDKTNQYGNASSEMMLSFTSGSFTQASSLYGFYVPIDGKEVSHVYIARTNAGSRFRFAFSESVPAVGVSYSNYTNESYDTRTQLCLLVPSGAKYMYVAFYRTSDTLTKEQLLAGMTIYYLIPGTITVDSGKESRIDKLKNEIFIAGDENLYDKRSDRQILALSDTSFSTGTSLYGFYVPINPEKGTTITIRRSNKGQRFRVVSCADVPANGTTYASGKQTQEDTSTQIVYNKIVSTDRYLYVAYYSTTQDTLTENELLAGMTIFYGTDFKETESRIDRLDYGKDVDFTNGRILDTGAIESSNKHIASDPIRVYGRYAVSCPSDYTMTVHEYSFDGKHKGVFNVTDSVRRLSHSGFIRVCLYANDDSDITPSTVDFSQIKMPLNRYSAKAFADCSSFVLDSENSVCADVYAYIDSVAENHQNYVSKSLICTETSGLPIYAYTLGSGNKKICIVCGQHGPGSDGDPRDSVITVAKIMHDLIDGNFTDNSFLQTLHDDYTMLFIPILNPYGFNNSSRRNASSVDTNRDWVNASTPEVAAARPVIIAFDADIVLDVHCNGTTPISDADVKMQFGFGATQNPLYLNAVSSYFGSYYDILLESRLPNTEDTLQYVIREVWGKIGGLLELKWWLKGKKWMHDYQAESGNYAMVVNSLKYLASVNDSDTFKFEHTPNQNQY